MSDSKAKDGTADRMSVLRYQYKQQSWLRQGHWSLIFKTMSSILSRRLSVMVSCTGDRP